MKPTYSKTLLAMLIAAAALGTGVTTSSRAATIGVDGATYFATNTSTFSASMNNANAFIKDDAGVLIADLSGTVVDYDFPNSPGYKGSADVIANISDGGFGGRANIDLWTESMDPLIDPAIAAQGDNGTPGSGTIDISTLSDGTAWILAGRWSGDVALNATMTDADGLLADVVMTEFVLPYNGAQGQHFAFEMNFADAGDYEEISWAVGGNYFTGVVVAESGAVPEPGSLALLGLGGLLVARRRRCSA